MKNFIQKNYLLPGDRIIVPKSVLGIVQHHAIFLGKNHFGIDMIAENVPGHKVSITSADDFFSENQNITEVIRFKGNNLERRQAVKRALDNLNIPYSLINFNCEHYANLVQHGKPYSEQIRFGFAIMFILTIAAFIISD